jgi:hypothetical protein
VLEGEAFGNLDGVLPLGFGSALSVFLVFDFFVIDDKLKEVGELHDDIDLVVGNVDCIGVRWQKLELAEQKVLHVGVRDDLTDVFEQFGMVGWLWGQWETVDLHL